MRFGLHRQIALAMLGLVAASALVMAVIIGLASERLEYALLNSQALREAEFLAEGLQQDPGARLPMMANTAVWLDRGGQIDAPPEFSRLPLGITHDAAARGRRFHVLRQDLPAGRLTLALDITAIERREDTLHLVLAAGALSTCLLAMAVAWWLARRVAAPITRLAAELRSASPDQPPRQLSERFRDDEVAVIAEALQDYVDRLSRHVERERAFARSASHELRSPLTVLRSSVELLMLEPTLPEHLRGAGQRATRAAKLMGELVEGLLILAREDAATPATAGGVAVTPLIREQVDDLRHSRPGAEVQLHLGSAEPVVTSPESHLRIVLDNLLRNALDHARGQAVEVQVDADGIRVMDRGPGVEPALIERLFEPGRRREDSRGTGLGLYIAREICRRHGWQLSADNRPDGGACFRLRFGGRTRPA